MMHEELTEAVYAALTLRHADAAPEEIAAAVGETPRRVADALAILASKGRVVFLTNGLLLSDTAWTRLCETTRRALAAYHKRNPFQKYAPLDTLPAPLAKAATVRDFDALVNQLGTQNFLVLDETRKKARLPDHEVIMPQGWKKPSREIAAVYQSAGLMPPDPANFQAHYPRDVSVRTILQILAETGELAPLAENLYIHADAIAQTKEVFRRLAMQAPQGVTPAAVRDATGSSRKIILPLLEYLDEIGFTQRNADTRTLATHKKPFA